MDKETFLDLQLDSDSHLLDKTLAARLRFFMSYTQSLTLHAHEDMRLHYPKDHNRLKGFEFLQDFHQTSRGQNPLWPILQHCHIDLTAWPYHSTSDKTRRSPKNRRIIPEMAPLVRALFDRLHPENMTIVVPDRLIDDGDMDDVTCEVFWWTCIQGLHAQHIELAGLQSVGVLHYFPSAEKSLSIRIDRPPHRDPGFVEDREYQSLNRLEARAVHVLCLKARRPLLHIDTLRLISLIRPDEYSAADPNHSPEVKAMSSVPASMAILMKERLRAGNRNDFRLTIMPDTSSESEAKVVWHTFKVPEL